MEKIRVLLAEDHTIVRKGLCSLLENEAGVEVVGEAEDGREAVKKVHLLRPDIVVMDITMPGLNGLEATRQIKKRYPEIKVLILSMHTNEEYVFQALRARASGYLEKKSAPGDLVTAIRSAQKGEIFLSPTISRIVVDEYVKRTDKATNHPDSFQKLTRREREILQLLAEGNSNQEIADKLYLSIKTVQTHRAHIFEKLKVHNIASLTRIAVARGLVGLDT